MELRFKKSGYPRSDRTASIGVTVDRRGNSISLYRHQWRQWNWDSRSVDVHDQIAPQPIGATEQTAEGTDSSPFDINRDNGNERVQKGGCPRSINTAAGQYDNGPLREQLLALQCLGTAHFKNLWEGGGGRAKYKKIFAQRKVKWKKIHARQLTLKNIHATA